MIMSARSPGHGPRTLALRASQRSVRRELTERVIIVIVAVMQGFSDLKAGSKPTGKAPSAMSVCGTRSFRVREHQTW